MGSPDEGAPRSDLVGSPRRPMIGPFERTLALRYLRGAQGRDERRGFLRFVVVAAIGGVAGTAGGLEGREGLVHAQQLRARAHHPACD